MHVLAICAGIGGLELGVKLATGNAARTVAVIEREGYCASVLRARMQDGSIDDCPIWSDVKTFDPKPWRGRVDCITAGYPCQPFSTAGRRAGHEDPRHLWPYIAGHIRVLRPRYVFCENVPGHLSLGFEQVCRELCEMGYGVEAGVFSAAEVGAPHLRKRLFFLAHSSSIDAGKQLLYRSRREALQPVHYGLQGAVANAEHGRRGPERTSGQPLGGPHDCLHAERKKNGGGARDCGQDVANPHSHGQRSGRAVECGPPHAAPSQCGADVADPHPVRQLQQGGPEHEERRRSGDGGGGASQGPAQRRLDIVASRHADLVDHLARGWPADWEDGVPRVAENQPHRVDRLRALGNAVVPQTAALAWTTLMQQASAHGTEDL